MKSVSPETVDKFIQLSGPLFEDVQQSGIFKDSKTFVDCIPKTDPQEIRKQYEDQKPKLHFNLKAFVYEHFMMPGAEETEIFKPGKTMDQHIEKLWDYLSRRPDEGISDFSTLIPLPHPYIVPGGRFREIYYWDTYFTAEGLAAAGRMDVVKNLCKNFAYLIDKVGHVPNGNRYYYISRSQPPFLVMLVDLIGRKEGTGAIEEFIPALKKEYDFWMEGSESLSDGETHRRIVRNNGTVLNRYWDDRPLPREESWREDFGLATKLNPEQTVKRYRHLRAGAESGWDFTSRWFRDEESLDTIRTTEILPVDLNALLWFMEHRLGLWTGEEQYVEAALKRKTHFDRFFWDEKQEFYFDYDWKADKRTKVWSMAGAYPLFVNLASEEQADYAAHTLENKFLKEGGLVSTLHSTGQQWDYPNGWAPLQWVAVQGLMNYGHNPLAKTIAERWLELNESVFNRTGKMMEKYNVCDLSLEAGGGEYPLQDGFGWTNGVAEALKTLFDL